jgi:hypothetical protein
VTITSGSSGVGDGTVQYSVSPNPDISPRSGTMTIASQTFTVNQMGTGCIFSFIPIASAFGSAGGSGEIQVTVTGPNPPQCQWTAVSNAPWITITSGANYMGNGTVAYTVDPNMGTQRSSSMTIAAVNYPVQQDGTFFDDFDDNVVAGDWTYSGNITFTEADSFLRANAADTGNAAQAIAAPVFDGCIECRLKTRMRVNIFARGLATFFGWFVDDQNHVELVMDEFNNSWTLNQVAGGSMIATASNSSQPINANENYDVELSFDGQSFVVKVNQITLLSLPMAAGSSPDGTIGFRVSETDASFDLIQALTVTPSRLKKFATGSAVGGASAVRRFEGS